MVVVVLPTPPFWLATATIRFIRSFARTVNWMCWGSEKRIPGA
jgi:uncharacterized membrane protein YbaN (DUF454 family)